MTDALRYTPKIFRHTVEFRRPFPVVDPQYGTTDLTWPGPGFVLTKAAVQLQGMPTEEVVGGNAVGQSNWLILCHPDDLRALGLIGPNGDSDEWIATNWQALWSDPELHVMKVKTKPMPRPSGLLAIPCEEIG